MKFPNICCALVVLLGFSGLSAGEIAPKPRLLPGQEAKLPISGLAESKVFENLCLYKYRVSTSSEECQTYCNQAFGFYYSYVWIEAARSFETALKHDPDCAVAWWGLSRSLEKWGKSKTPSAVPFLAGVGALWQNQLPDKYAKSPADFALEQAKTKMTQASHREQLLITARLQEKGMWPNVKPEERKKKATETLDELLTLYEDDEEGWFARAQIAEGRHGSAPFFKALLKLNPLHPGANHEFVHFFEGIRRPALGWQNAEGYMASSPGLPHAFHMQAHLAMRIGKWQSTSDWSRRAIEMQKAYHEFQGVKPSEDHQFNHHMETLTRSLVHDGRFQEATEIQKLARSYKYSFNPEWYRMAITQHQWDVASQLATELGKRNKTDGEYYRAVLALEQGDVTTAKKHWEAMQPKKNPKDKPGTPSRRGSSRNDWKLLEIEGRIQCQSGDGIDGCQKFRDIIAKSKDDYSHHAWGGGAYFMETWGVAALEAGIATEAEEAFQEALAHDAGSVRGALGLWALCERLGRYEEASRYLKVALRCWAKADVKDFDRLKLDMAKRAEKLTQPKPENQSRK